MSLNGAEPELFILDTGLIGMMISEDYARVSYARQSGETQTIRGSGGSKLHTLKVAKNLLIDIEGLQWPIKSAKIAGADVTQPITETLGHSFDGMLGSFLFEKYVVKVDFQMPQLTLYPAQNFEYTGDGIVLPMTIQNRKPYVDISIQASAKSLPKKGRFLIDLGSNRSIDIRGGLDIPSGLPKRHVLGFGGKSLSPMGRVHQLLLGSHTIANPIATFERSEVSPNQHSAPLSGRIGNLLLKRFKVIFDFPKERLILEPLALPTPTQADMSGLRLKQLVDGEKQVIVDYVYPDGPAKSAGILPGDRLLKIDGQSVSTMNLWEIRQRLIDQPLTIRQLLILRAQNQRAFSLELRPLI